MQKVPFWWLMALVTFLLEPLAYEQFQSICPESSIEMRTLQLVFHFMTSWAPELRFMSPVVCRLPTALILSGGFAFWRAGGIQRTFLQTLYRKAQEAIYLLNQSFTRLKGYKVMVAIVTRPSPPGHFLLLYEYGRPIENDEHWPPRFSQFNSDILQ